MKALVIGGTGPTGPFIVQGLLRRGYQVAVLNRGKHDTPEIPDEVERIVSDPHFREPLAESLAGRRFDVIVATYGRIRHVAEVVAGHTDRLITIGGSPGMRGSRQPERLFPVGWQTPLPETAPRVESSQEFHFGYMARITEDAVMARHDAGDYVATHLRYPIIYGPRQLRPAEWAVMRRILDGRKHIVLPDGGLTLLTRGYGENMAEAVLLALDRSDVAGGRIYNAGDCHQLTLAQWVEVITQTMGATLEPINVPGPLAFPARDLMLNRRNSHHQLFDTHRIRAELGYTDKVPPLEALAATVRAYLDAPPVETEEMKAQRAIHYRTEDQMAAICRDAHARLAAVEHIDPEYEHPYAHPRRQGEADHRGR
ncbi:MAG: NAD-dependent epimerase/dehydratase family protein [Gammaproteobacteria bacterium]|nr:NAD-dependent epimerase/dehydratase family protein [Gammaproteobacteria bacterium]